MTSATTTAETKAPIIWVIGGSDTRAGAGIQADLLTAERFHVCCYTIVSAVTAQSQNSVSAIEPVADEIFIQQLNTIREDGKPNAIKIGLLAAQSQVDLLADWLNKNPTPVFIDPVQIASCGDSLTAEAVDLSPLIALAELITPNAQELEALGGAEKLKQLGIKNLLQTGISDDKHIIADDLISFSTDKKISWTHKRLDAPSNHGTGCTLSTAIASAYAKGYDLYDAITQAIAYVFRGLEANPVANTRRSVAHLGLPAELSQWPKANDHAIANTQNRKHEFKFPTLTDPIGFYPVVDSVELLEKLVTLGVGTIQLRIKQSSDSQRLRDQIKQAVDICKNTKTQLFINDYWDLACEFGAYGVHLGQEDLQTADLSSIENAGLRLGLSTHGYYELCLAKHFNPSYLALGHIFQTPTKIMPSKPQGLNRLEDYARICSETPTVAIGGINKSNTERVLASGVNGIAVVRAVTESTNLQGTVNAFKHIFERMCVPHNIGD